MTTRQEIAHKQFYSLPAVLAASKKYSWRQSALTEARAVARFFSEEKLCVDDLLTRFDLKPEDFVIRFGDFTDEGLEFIRAYFSKWENNVARWNYEPTEEQYMAGLKRLYVKYLAEKNA